MRSRPAAPPASSIGTITNWVVYDGREIPLGDGEHVLGRDSDARVELRSPAVSRHHARIVISGASATLEDLGSKNGTSVRGQTLTSPLQLADGDEIRIGGFVLTFRTVSAKGSTKRPPDRDRGAASTTFVSASVLAGLLGWHDGHFT